MIRQPLVRIVYPDPGDLMAAPGIPALGHMQPALALELLALLTLRDAAVDDLIHRWRHHKHSSHHVLAFTLIVVCTSQHWDSFASATTNGPRNSGTDQTTSTWHRSSPVSHRRT